jgi:hypothetical protein
MRCRRSFCGSTILMRSIQGLGLWLSWVLPSWKRMGFAEVLSGGSRSRNYISTSPCFNHPIPFSCPNMPVRRSRVMLLPVLAAERGAGHCSLCSWRIPFAILSNHQGHHTQIVTVRWARKMPTRRSVPGLATFFNPVEFRRFCSPIPFMHWATLD